MKTADSITDEEIRELRQSTRSRAVRDACSIALNECDYGVGPGAQRSARVRCADAYNTHQNNTTTETK